MALSWEGLNFQTFLGSAVILVGEFYQILRAALRCNFFWLVLLRLLLDYEFCIGWIIEEFEGFRQLRTDATILRKLGVFRFS